MQTIRLFEAFAGYGSQLMAMRRLERAFPALIKVELIAVLSKSRCYQVAGNSIVVDVLEAIFRQLFIENTNTNQQTELF